jgi:hypothetical protein
VQPAVRITDAQASEAARSLAAARWGTTKADRLIDEISERRDQLGDIQRARLRELAEEDES